MHYNLIHFRISTGKHFLVSTRKSVFLIAFYSSEISSIPSSKMFYRQLVKTTIKSFGRQATSVAVMAKFPLYSNSMKNLSTRRIPEFQIRYFSSKVEDSKSSTAPFSGELTNEDIDKMVKSDKVVAFIKGVPEQPMCGFSKLVVQILDMHGVKFTSFDVLENDSLRRNMKLYSNWPTFPQVFVDGKLVGGADIMLEMHKNKELAELLKKVGIKSAYSDDE